MSNYTVELTGKEREQYIREHFKCEECGKPLTDEDAYGHDCEV